MSSCVVMLPCSPYIHNICQSVQIGDEEVATPATGEESLEKKETIVTVTDVTSVKVDLFSVDKQVKNKVVTADVTKVLTTFKPESPDVTRAAKKIEKEKQAFIYDDDSDEAFVEEEDVKKESGDKVAEENLGAISKTRLVSSLFEI